jgi:hypothetical protein
MVWALLGPLLVVLFDALVFLIVVRLVSLSSREDECTWLESGLSSLEAGSEMEKMPIPPHAA